MDAAEAAAVLARARQGDSDAFRALVERHSRTVQYALGALSPLERAAFTLRHYEGRSIDEIGRTLGLGTSAAKHSVFRAVKKLRHALQPLRSLANRGLAPQESQR